MLLIARHAINFSLPNQEDHAHHTSPLALDELGGHQPVSVRTPRRGQVALRHLERVVVLVGVLHRKDRRPAAMPLSLSRNTAERKKQAAKRCGNALSGNVAVEEARADHQQKAVLLAACSTYVLLIF